MTVEVVRLPHCPASGPGSRGSAGAICLAIGILDVAAAVTPRLWRRVHLLADVLPGALSAGHRRRAARRGRRLHAAARGPWPGASAGPGSSRSCCSPPRSCCTSCRPGPAPRPGRRLARPCWSALLTFQSEFYAARGPVHPLVRAALPAGAAAAEPAARACWWRTGSAAGSASGSASGPGAAVRRVPAWSASRHRWTSSPGVRPDVVYYSLLALGPGHVRDVPVPAAARAAPAAAADGCRTRTRMRELLARHGERDSLGLLRPAPRQERGVVADRQGLHRATA